MFPRTLEKTIKKAVKTFPAIVVTGPRQSGKTTLLKALFEKTHKFISLENPDVRIRAKEDPIGFLNQYKCPIILDEIQYIPELLSYIKTRIDEDRKPGQWLFAGSQNFVLMQSISQSLAGRAAILSLLPFSFGERVKKGHNLKNIDDWLKNLNNEKIKNRSGKKEKLSKIILRGNYPEMAAKKPDRQLWCGSYIATYLERDVRNLAQIGDLGLFERFLRLCAIRTGQILNITEIAGEVGVSVTTIKRWISILETGYLIFLLNPYYRNIGKRLVKSPKIYFCDTGLASYLLGLNDEESLYNSPHFGNLFETMIVTDVLKRYVHAGEMPSMYYLRTRDGLEIDLVLESGQKLFLFEIKSSATITGKHVGSLERMNRENKSVEMASLISAAEQNFLVKNNIMNFSWNEILSF